MRKYKFASREIICYTGNYLTANEIKSYENRYGRLIWVEYKGLRVLSQ